jgi:hypothetical protein
MLNCQHPRIEGTMTTSHNLVLKPRMGQIPPLWDGKVGLRCHAALQQVLLSSRASNRRPYD